MSNSHPQLFSSPVQGDASDERYTPPHVFAALGVTFDLDVAAPPGGVPWIPARAVLCPTDDGLACPWRGLVWCNPPFSNAGPWADRWIEHGNGVLLFPLNVNASWLFRVLAAVPRLLLLEHLRFHSPTHVGRHVPVLVALAGLGDGVAAVDRAATQLRGVMLSVALLGIGGYASVAGITIRATPIPRLW